jgi:hypothetical protein
VIQTLKYIGLDVRAIVERISLFSLHLTVLQERARPLIQRLRNIVPDLSNQESRQVEPDSRYLELKKRALQAFQCRLMLESVAANGKSDLMVVDIGDSAGTHMIYLKNLVNGDGNLKTLSVNLDSRAIRKIKARGLDALQCRAECLDLSQPVDFYVSFEMLEHLHNPSIFLHRLAKKKETSRLLVTVPYLKRSRVGMHSIRANSGNAVYAEDEHIFELSPADWSLLFLHSGWKVIKTEIHYQYPRYLGPFSYVLRRFWRHVDFEGFLGILAERDLTHADLYQDWEDS